MIREKNETASQYQPKVEIIINQDEDQKSFEIIVKDNGGGFTTLNRKHFTHLDTINPQKEGLRLHPKGQGRLAIVYFSDNATYSSVYQKQNGEFWQKFFEYPEENSPLFDIEGLEGNKTNKTDSETILTLNISKQQTYKRAETFFLKYHDIESVKNWFIENFFPLLMEIERLQLHIELNGQKTQIDRPYIEKNICSIKFTVTFEPEFNENSEFKLWLIKKMEQPKTKNLITCFARHLRAELGEGKLEYEIDIPDAYDWFLTSEYFDDNVDQKGDRIDLPPEHIEKIQLSLANALDKYFAEQINENRAETKRNMTKAKEKYHSLSVFMDESKTTTTNRILKEADFVNTAIESKGKAEKSYWTSQEPKMEDAEKLLNSSLHIYIDHRKKILQKLETLIRKFDEEGEEKSELEDDIHDLFLQRGETLNSSSQINHLHNLWILDDKYTTFSKTFKALSSRKGQKASDIYLWIDDPGRPKELLILELKSTTRAHNAGDKYESMIAQVKRYAAQFYKNPSKILNWNVEPDKVLYFGVVLARKSDVYRELSSNNISGSPNKIPFLDASYFFNDKFSIEINSNNTPRLEEIRIEMYSYEDIYSLASNRNDVFFRLLKGELNIEM